MTISLIVSRYRILCEAAFKAKRYSINVNCSYCACARACCSNAVPTTYGALIITSPLVRKTSEISFGLALWHAGKLLQCHTNRSCETVFGKALKVSGYEMMCVKNKCFLQTVCLKLHFSFVFLVGQKTFQDRLARVKACFCMRSGTPLGISSH